MIDDHARLPPGLALAWGHTRPPSRGPKPAHTVEQVVAAAMDLADEEGLAALSMPKLGRRLGFTANALYRYVRSKDELLVLITDAGWAGPPDSLPDEENWREAAKTWARALIDRFGVHPWLLDLPIRGAPSTPNLLRWLEVFLQSMTGSGLGGQDALGCAVLLDGYARSTAALFRDLAASATAPVESAAVAGFLQPLLRERGYPLVAAMLAGGDYSDDVDLEADVEFGLNRVLDGIDVLIASKKVS